jgi:hypothetical protein
VILKDEMAERMKEMREQMAGLFSKDLVGFK